LESGSASRETAWKPGVERRLSWKRPKTTRRPPTATRMIRPAALVKVTPSNRAPPPKATMMPAIKKNMDAPAASAAPKGKDW